MKTEQHSFPARHLFPQERFFSVKVFSETATEIQGFRDIIGLEKEEKMKGFIHVLVSHH